MALTIKVLARGHVSGTISSGTTAPLYMASATAPAKAAIVKAWRFTNTSDASVTVNLYFQKNVPSSGGGHFSSTAARLIFPVNFVIPPRYTAVDDLDLTLGSGDGIFAVCSTDGVVHFLVSGLEEDVLPS